MTRRRQSAGQIICRMRQAEVLSGQGRTIEEICREPSVSNSTYFMWCREYGGMGIDQVRPLRELEKENNRLKRTVADQALDIQILKDVSPGNFCAQGGVVPECSMHVCMVPECGLQNHVCTDPHCAGVECTDRLDREALWARY